MADMRRFIIDKMPLIFSTPRYFGHIPLLAVPCRTLQLAIPQYSQGRNDETSLGYDAFPPHLTNSDSLCDVRIISAVGFVMNLS